MLRDCSALIVDREPFFGYGVAVTDVDGNRRDELVVCGFGVPNRVLSWNGSGLEDATPRLVADPDRHAIGIAAGDLDGDGREELYVLNTDTFAGRKRFGDRLFDFHAGGGVVDLFDFAANAAAVNLTAGRSVCAIDRSGNGRYGFAVASYGGPMRLFELDADGRLGDLASEAGLALLTGGRSLVAAPLVTPRPDLFAANENGANFLFANVGGTFDEVGDLYGLADPDEHGRGVAVLDLGADGFGLFVANWEGPARLWRRVGPLSFGDEAISAMAARWRARTVIAADFDNDGYEEIFVNTMGEANHLFGWRDGQWAEIDLGDAEERWGCGTGAAVADVDGDGRLELVVVHGEAAAQPLTLYRAGAAADGNHWLRVRPRTAAGAPARGAVVEVAAGGRRQCRVIDGGSGYLCQMEPVAHVGLGRVDSVDEVTVRWPDGSARTVSSVAVDQELEFLL